MKKYRTFWMPLCLVFYRLLTVTAQYCPDGEYTCTDGRCIEYDRSCDGRVDCSDGSDEFKCDPDPDPLPTSTIYRNTDYAPTNERDPDPDPLPLSTTSRNTDSSPTNERGAPTDTLLMLNNGTVNLTVQEGQNVVLTCQSHGRPTPRITIHDEPHDRIKNNASGHSASSLHQVLVHNIDSARCQNSTTYRCRANNNFGLSNESFATLFVLCAPRREDTVTTTTATPTPLNYDGQTVSFTFTVIAYPPLENTPQTCYNSKMVNVTFNKCSITCTVTNFIYKSTCKVTIDGVTADDAGLYRIRPKNEYGSAADDVTFNLTVKDPDPDPLLTSTISRNSDSVHSNERDPDPGTLPTSTTSRNTDSSPTNEIDYFIGLLCFKHHLCDGVKAKIVLQLLNRTVRRSPFWIGVAIFVWRKNKRKRKKEYDMSGTQGGEIPSSHQDFIMLRSHPDQIQQPERPHPDQIQQPERPLPHQNQQPERSHPDQIQQSERPHPEKIQQFKREHSQYCPDGQFTCTDGRCIEYERSCDGKEDCTDGFDEFGCENPEPVPLPTSTTDSSPTNEKDPHPGTLPTSTTSRNTDSSPTNERDGPFNVSIFGPLHLRPNQNVSLSCIAYGTFPGVNYTWSGISCVHIESLTNGSMCSFTPSERDDNTTVTCVAINRRDPRLSRTATYNISIAGVWQKARHQSSRMWA